MRDMQINVQPLKFGKQCRILGKALRCKSRPQFALFGDDGKPYLSRLECSVCKKHLVRAIKELKKRQIAEIEAAQKKKGQS